MAGGEVVPVLVALPADVLEWLNAESAERGLTAAELGGLLLAAAVRIKRRERAELDLSKSDAFRDG